MVDRSEFEDLKKRVENLEKTLEDHDIDLYYEDLPENQKKL